MSALDQFDVSRQISIGSGPGGDRLCDDGSAASGRMKAVMAYGSTEDEAVRKVKSITLQVLADMIESGEDIPAPSAS